MIRVHVNPMEALGYLTKAENVQNLAPGPLSRHSIRR